MIINRFLSKVRDLANCYFMVIISQYQCTVLRILTILLLVNLPFYSHAQTYFVVHNTGTIGQNVHLKTNAGSSIITDVHADGYSVAQNQIPYLDTLWYLIDMPSRTSTPRTGYACGGQGGSGYGSLMPSCNLSTLKVLKQTVIHTAIGVSKSVVKISTDTAYVCSGQYYAIAQYQYNGSDIWYQIYFAQCDGKVSSGWIAGYYGGSWRVSTNAINYIALSSPKLTDPPTNITSSSMHLSWSDNPVTYNTLYTYEYNSDSFHTKLDTITLSSLNSGTSYTLNIIARNGACYSDISNTVTKSTSSGCISPSITTNPTSLSTIPPSGTSFSVYASGTSLSYQWKVSTDGGKSWTNLSNSSLYSGVTTSSLSLSSTTTGMNGYEYHCVVSNTCGVDSGTSATLSTNTSCISPSCTISSTPTVIAGNWAAFKVLYSGGTTPITYQWQVKESGSPNFSDIPGETATTLILKSVATSMIGNLYRCDVRNSCTYGYNHSTNVSSIKVILPTSAAIDKNYPQYCVAEPIQVGTGTYRYEHTDINVPIVNGELKVTRFYNSFNHNLDGPMGYGWSHSLNYYFVNQGDTITNVYYPDGHVAAFIPSNFGWSFTPQYGGTSDSFVRKSHDFFWLITKEKIIYQFDAATGNLFDIYDKNGVNIHLEYTYKYSDSSELLSAQQLPNGRIINFGWGTFGRVHRFNSIYEPGGHIINLDYKNGNLIMASDLNYNHTQYTYDTNHQLTSIVSPYLDTVLTNIYDSKNRVIGQYDAYKKLTSIAYDSPSIGYTTITYPDNTKEVMLKDSSYRVTNVKNAIGRIRLYAYDNNNNKDTLINEKGEVEIRRYDYFSNLTYDSLIDSRISRFSYNDFAEPTKLTDPSGQITNLSYDNAGNLDTIFYPDGSYRYLTVNSDGTISAYTDGLGHVTSLFYNSYGDVDSVVIPVGTKRYNHDSHGRTTRFADENGNPVLFTYDGNGNTTDIADTLGRHLQFQYDWNNQLHVFTDRRGLKYNLTFDTKGRQTSTTYPNGGKDSIRYDIMDRPLSMINANGDSISFTYDSIGRPITKTNALGTVSIQYDNLGNIVNFTDATGISKIFSYEHSSQLHSVADQLGNTIYFNHDKVDNISSSIDALASSNTYFHDAMNRVKKVFDPYNDSTNYFYDANGNFKSLIDGNAHTQNFYYDKSNRLSEYQDADLKSMLFFRDKVGNPTLISKSTGNISIRYDAVNRPTKITRSASDFDSFAYDMNDNDTFMRNNAGTSHFTFDSLNNILSYSDPFGKTVKYGYYIDGKRRFITYPGNNTIYYSYNKAGLLDTVTDWNKKIFIYTYDAAGRPKRLLYPDSSHCDYAYNNVGRLVSKISYTKLGKILCSNVFNLDPNGVPISDSTFKLQLDTANYNYGYSKNDALLTDSKNTYSNDSSGNRISQGVKASYKFSSDNFLDTIIKGSNNTSFLYNPLRARIQRKAGGKTTKYVLDLSGAISEVIQTTDALGKVQANYIYGLALLESIDSINTTTLYHFDAYHNTRVITDIVGAVKDSFTYYSFGGILSHRGSSIQPFTFLGEMGVEYEDSGLYYIRARYYDALDGRFLSKDPLMGNKSDPQCLNRYVYGMNDPISYHDFNGFCSESGPMCMADPYIYDPISSIKNEVNALWNPIAAQIYSVPVPQLNHYTRYKANPEEFNNLLNSADKWGTRFQLAGILLTPIPGVDVAVGLPLFEIGTYLSGGSSVGKIGSFISNNNNEGAVIEASSLVVDALADREIHTIFSSTKPTPAINFVKFIVSFGTKETKKLFN